MAYVVLVLAVAGGLWLAWRVRQRRQRQADLLASPLSQAEREIVVREVPLVLRLPEALQARLEGRINRFLDQVDFVGCNGLEVTEEMRLSIAAQACLLIANNDLWYDNLTSVLIYPGAFKSRQARRSGYVVTEREVVRSGESWMRGPVILSWAHAHLGAANDHDGHNVVFHEFAHQLDDLSGRTDGVPALDTAEDVMAWRRTFAAAQERHARAVGAGQRTVIDAYGAEGPQEFFAVAVEAFLETPGALKRAEPEVYARLAELLGLEPVEWAAQGR